MSEIDELKRAYIENAQLHDKASEEGDYKRANPAHDAVIDAYRQLRSAGDEGANALQGLMDHENASVRCWASTHCLPLCEDKAITTLRAIAEGSGVVALDAEMVLSEWNKGTLKLPT